MKCRRRIILEYFRESFEDENQETGDECCDVCSMKDSKDLINCYEEIKAVLTTVQHFSDKGEKQVCFYHTAT